MIQLSNDTNSGIRTHGEEAYPNESCGVLAGKWQDGRAMVSKIIRLRNINTESPRTRYSVDPLELVKVERDLDTEGLEMIGIYHSHPDHPSKPSKYDQDHAWPYLVYVVLSVDQGKANKLTAWQLQNQLQNSKFIELKVKL